MLGRLHQAVPLPAERADERHDAVFSGRVDRGIRDLGKDLLEVVEEELGLIGERGEGRVVAHGARRFHRAGNHRRQQDAQVLERVAEHPLACEQVCFAVLHRSLCTLRQLVQLGQVPGHPLGVRPPCGAVILELLVRDDPTFFGVDEQHAPRLEPTLVDDRLGVDREHARLRGEHRKVVLGHPVARRAQAVAVEHAAHAAPVREGHRSGPVPGLHQTLVIAVEGLLLCRHQRIAVPRFRDQHHHGVRQRAPRQHQELERIVDLGGVRRPAPDDREDLREVISP